MLPGIFQYAALFTGYGNLTSSSQFSNVQSFDHWSGTEYAPNPANAWVFYTVNGSQDCGAKFSTLYAVASADFVAIRPRAAPNR